MLLGFLTSTQPTIIELKVPQDGPRQFRGAEINIDLPGVDEAGPVVPHVGYQAPGKGRQGGNQTGHILLDSVPYNRGRLSDEKRLRK
jgi:hypothetical protein